MTLSPDGTILATTDPTDGLVLRNAATGAPIRSLAPGADPLGRPAFSPGGALVAAVQTTAGSAEPDGITVWEVASGRCLARLPVARGPNGCRCGFLPGGALLGAVFDLKEVPSEFSSVWGLAGDPRRPRLLARFDGMPAARMDWNGGDLLTLESRANAALRDPITATTARAFDIDNSDQGINAADCTAGGEIVAAVSGPPWRLTVWDGKTGQRLAACTVPPNIVRLTISPGGAILAAVDIRQNVYLINRKSGAARRIVSERIQHPRPPTVAFSPDGTRLAIALSSRPEEGDPSPVSLWDPASGRMLATLEGHTDRVRAVAFAPNGRLLASASSDGTVRLWDVATWRERQVLRGHGNTVHAVAFAPDGRALASAGNDGDIRLWDLRPDGTTSLSRALHNRTNLMALAYSPDGRLIAAADTLGSIAVWDLATSTLSRLIHGDGDGLRQLAFSPDPGAPGLAAAGIKGTIRLWDPITGQELLGLAAHRAQVNGLAFSPDGSILASAAHDGAIRLWRAEP